MCHALAQRLTIFASKLAAMANKRTKEEFEKALMHSRSIAGMCRALNLKPCGGNYRLMHNAIEKYDLDTSHFTGQGWNVGLKYRPVKVKSMSDILVKNSAYQSYKLRKRIIKEGIKQHVCDNCGLLEWQGVPIPLELHHINGDNRDNRLENIQLLCPNCHALTESYRGRNKKK